MFTEYNKSDKIILKANITGKVDLATVPKFYPIEGLKTISGLLNLNLDFNLFYNNNPNSNLDFVLKE